MSRLTTREHWDEVWRDGTARYEQGPKSKLKGIIKRILGKKLLSYKIAYSDYLEWEVIYPQFLPRAEGLKIVEIGSAPGFRLVRFHKEFGYTPYGLEFSDTGAEFNRRVFDGNGIDPDNVIHNDFFADTFLEQYREFFDLVISSSFVEHFSNPQEIVDRHVALLKPGGVLIVVIPNLRGLNYLLGTSLKKEWKEIHCFDIMDRRKFALLFEKAGLTPSCCRYVGTFGVDGLQVTPGSWLRPLLSLCQKLQLGVNVLYRVVFRTRSPEHKWFSPYLIYIGKKEQNKHI